MRVLHFVHRLPPEYSGAAFQALRLIEAMDELDGERVENHVVAYARHPEACEPPPGIPVSVVQLRSGLLGKVRQYADLWHTYQRIRPDIVHVHGYHRPAVLFARSCPTVLKTTLLEVDDVPSIRRKGLLDARLVDGVERVISMTPAIAAANAGAVTSIIPNGVDTRVFRPSGETAPATRSSLGFGEDELLFFFVGGDSVRKGVRTRDTDSVREGSPTRKESRGGRNTPSWRR